ncbi:hypothetical protein B7494_g2262 [Chlorociboria aeruginascens]|nr:hypothetical protein B7494_g2262 [Chlorociboria aeruginascens]
MGGRPHGKDAASQDLGLDAAETMARKLERNDTFESHKGRGSAARNTIRSVTPEPFEPLDERPMDTDGTERLKRSLDFEPFSAQTSPRSIPGGEKPRDRRQGLVFHDTLENDSSDETWSALPANFQVRPRTRTLDQPPRYHSSSKSLITPRHRIGSIHSTNSSSFHDVGLRTASDTSVATRSTPPTVQKSGSVKRSGGGRRLVKRPSRPTSPSPPPPLMNDVPSVDAFPRPVVTGDINEILILMKTLCGRMRGDVEYQTGQNGPWYSGICYIDETKGSLMYEGGDRGPFHLTIVTDLRGCHVKPVNLAEKKAECLLLSNLTQGFELYLLPTAPEQFNLWLSALLCWQQAKPATFSVRPPGLATLPAGDQKGDQERDSTFGTSKDVNIIKVGELLLWDKGVPLSPADVMRRPTTRDMSSRGRTWRRVSCTLQDNGELKFFPENNPSTLSIIQLSQLSRCAIQRLDKSVLDEEYCIAIFPQYTSSSTELSIFRPIYIALESRVLFEVWFVLLLSFSIPEIYGPQQLDDGENYELPETPLGHSSPTNDMFRIEKSITLRLVEAKIRKSVPHSDISHNSSRHSAKIEKDPSLGDYFAEVVLDGEVRARTMTKAETRNPFWREDCEFLNLPPYIPRLSIILKRIQHPEVATYGVLSSSSVHVLVPSLEIVYGTVEIPMEKLELGKDDETWWPILSENQERIGEMFLKLRRDELVVLLDKDYRPISELLHHFSSGLTLQIAQAIPSHLRKLSEILMNIFQVSGHAGNWLKALVEDEIDSVTKETPTNRLRWSKRVGSNESFSSVSEREQSVRDMSKSLQGEANLLFRGNSLLTQALDFHMRRVGKEYLVEVLFEKINAINALNPDCEVDPSRISPEQDVSKNWTQLIKLTTDIWNKISDSASRCPDDLRKIFKYIRAVAEDRYGDFLRTVAYTSVSGFLFLRYLCPAILNPKLFGLLPDHPPQKAQRTLTLIAKSLQALANLSTFGQKEEWMEPMNRFLYNHKQSIKKYLDDVCSIPVEHNTSTLPASYSTPITILTRLPPTSREGFPSLPYLIDQARNFAALVRLWLDATSHLQETDDELDGFNQQCIDLQHRTDECLGKAEGGDRPVDHVSLQLIDKVGNLESSTIQDEFNIGIQSPPLEYTTAPRSAGSGSTRKERQGLWDTTFGHDFTNQKPHGPENGALPASPPSRGQSRTEKRGFLNTLRRKGKDTPGGSSDHLSLSRPGGMI